MNLKCVVMISGGERGRGGVEFIGEVEIINFLDAYRIMGVPTHYAP